MEIYHCPQCKLRFRGETTACPVDGEPLERLEDPLLGRVIAGRYLIDAEIGRGGMGVVYRAAYQAIARDVAIKFLHPNHASDLTYRKRFLGEARAANQIDHENIIDVTDFGETDDGYVYLVMEYLQGHPLDRTLATGPLPAMRALRIAEQVAQGLGRAHELDVIHRDVKPGNVFLVRRRDGSDLVKLLDFGIARFERELRVTTRGTLLGTPEYIAPEQAHTGEVSPRTDLYALGCVLYEMLVGHPPFRGTTSEILVKQMREPPLPPSEANPHVPVVLDPLLLKLLAKDPGQRHRDAFHLIDELRAVHLQLANQPTPPELALLPSSPQPAAQVFFNAPPHAPNPPTPESTHAPSPISGSVLRVGQPTLYLPLGRDAWAERVADYRRQLAELHPDGAMQEPIREAIESMEGIVGETERLRSTMHDSAQVLAQNQDEVKATRLRIGHALDELASDESRLARTEQAERQELKATEETLQRAIEALPARVDIEAIARSQGQALSHPHALLIQGLGLGVDKLQRAQRRVTDLRQHQTWLVEQQEDIRFQIVQLKERLASLNEQTSLTQSTVNSRVQTAEVQLRDDLDRLVMYAERISLYLRSRAAQGVLG